MKRYLKSTDIIDCDAESIKEKTKTITEGLETDKAKAIALFYFVRDGIKFDAFAPGYVKEHYKASTILERGKGYCQHKAVLLVALARAAGIPARLGYMDIRDHSLPEKIRKMMAGDNRVFYHGYAELYVDGKWVQVSATFDLETCRRNRFVPVEFDGVKDTRDPSHDLDGKPHIEYLRDRGNYEDFPWDDIINARLEFAAQSGKDLSQLMADWWKNKPS
jgi:transglutaminase-like putative cysteine protease